MAGNAAVAQESRTDDEITASVLAVIGRVHGVVGESSMPTPLHVRSTMRVELIGHFKPCMTEIYLHI